MKHLNLFTPGLNVPISHRNVVVETIHCRHTNHIQPTVLQQGNGTSEPRFREKNPHGMDWRYFLVSPGSRGINDIFYQGSFPFFPLFLCSHSWC